MRASGINSKDECSICLENFTKSRPATVTSCSHEFHKKCIQKWQHGSDQCPVCKTALSPKNTTRCRKKRQSGEDMTSTSDSEELGNFKSKGGSKRNETSEPSLRRSTRNKANSSEGKAGGLKGTKGYEEEELNYDPEWDVCTTDHPSDPLVAKNLAEGVVLPYQATELAEMDNNLLIQGTYVNCVRALNFVSTALTRATEISEREQDLEIKIVEKEAHITELKKQLESAEARALAAKARVEEVEKAAAQEHEKALRVSKMHMTQRDASISELTRNLKSVEARATAAEAALKNVEKDWRLRVAEASDKAIKEFKSSEQYRNALVEYAFSSFNEVYAVMRKRAGSG